MRSQNPPEILPFLELIKARLNKKNAKKCQRCGRELTYSIRMHGHCLEKYSDFSIKHKLRFGRKIQRSLALPDFDISRKCIMCREEMRGESKGKIQLCSYCLDEELKGKIYDSTPSSAVSRLL